MSKLSKIVVSTLVVVPLFAMAASCRNEEEGDSSYADMSHSVS